LYIREVHSSLVSAKDTGRVVSPWFVLAVPVVTIVGLIAAELFAQRLSATVNDDALSIATNAAPAIAHLSDARGKLVQIALAASSAVSSARPVDADVVAALTGPLSALRGDLRHYLEQPFYPLEDRRYAEVDRAVHVLEARVAQSQRAIDEGDRGRALDLLENGVLPAILPVDRSISQLVLLNAEQGHQLGLAIPRQRLRAHRIGYWLQALTAILGLVLMGFVIRGVRAYAQLLARARAAARARDDLVATVSHDLRNPISAIIVSISSLRRKSSDPTIGKFVSYIERATERMTRLIGDLTDAAKIEAGLFRIDRKPEVVAKMIETAVEMFRAIGDDRSIHVVAHPPPDDAVVLCERHMILRVLANLLSNAVKFSPQDGAVVVSAECLPDQVRFSVRDDGPGILPEHRSRVFDRYWQQNEGDRRGSGLGLYIAKGIVEAHEGRIWIDMEGRGTTVCFTLPRALDC
jgi:signal transduction histidine kinase